MKNPIYTGFMLIVLCSCSGRIEEGRLIQGEANPVSLRITDYNGGIIHVMIRCDSATNVDIVASQSSFFDQSIKVILSNMHGECSLWEYGHGGYSRNWKSFQTMKTGEVIDFELDLNEKEDWICDDFKIKDISWIGVLFLPVHQRLEDYYKIKGSVVNITNPLQVVLSDFLDVRQK